MTGKLKIGILLDSFLIQAWQYSIITGLKNSDHAEINLVISGKSSKHKTRRALNPVISFHIKLDSLIFGRRESYSKERDVSHLLKEIPDIMADKPDGEEWLFGEANLTLIRNYNTDIILSLSSGILNDEILKIPRLGVWYFPVSQKNGKSYLIAGYSEVVKQEPVAGARLAIRENNDGKERVLASSFESTCSYSVKITGNRIFWRSSLFIFRILAGLQRAGEDYVKALSDGNKMGDDIEDVPYRMPGTAEAAGNFFRNASVTIRKMTKKIFFTDAFAWVLCFDSLSREPLETFQNNFRDFTTIDPPKGKFWADPFVISENGAIYIFVEEFLYRKNRAHLSVLTLDRTGHLLDNRIILEKPYHLSYPFIFKNGDNYFMVPESSENRTIDLYRCVQFPDRWVYEKTIMKDLKAVDTTLFYYNDKWWLFTVIDETDGISGCETELFLFYSDSPVSDDWVSHPMNPVVADSRKARPAGKLFMDGGRIYRPSQDCSIRYGNSLNLNEIIVLTETDYLEKEIYKNKPVWNKNLRGMHTFNTDKGITIIDAYSYHRRNLFDFIR